MCNSFLTVYEEYQALSNTRTNLCVGIEYINCCWYCKYYYCLDETHGFT